MEFKEIKEKIWDKLEGRTKDLNNFLRQITVNPEQLFLVDAADSDEEKALKLENQRLFNQSLLEVNLHLTRDERNQIRITRNNTVALRKAFAIFLEKKLKQLSGEQDEGELYQNLLAVILRDENKANEFFDFSFDQDSLDPGDSFLDIAATPLANGLIELSKNSYSQDIEAILQNVILDEPQFEEATKSDLYTTSPDLTTSNVSNAFKTLLESVFADEIPKISNFDSQFTSDPLVVLNELIEKYKEDKTTADLKSKLATYSPLRLREKLAFRYLSDHINKIERLNPSISRSLYNFSQDPKGKTILADLEIRSGVTIKDCLPLLGSGSNIKKEDAVLALSVFLRDKPSFYAYIKPKLSGSSEYEINQQFEQFFEIFKLQIQRVYNEISRDPNQSQHNIDAINYLYQQFVEYEDSKISTLQTTRAKTRSRIDSVLSNSPIFNERNTDELRQKSNQFAELLSSNFRKGIRRLEPKEIDELRSSRVEYAKKRAEVVAAQQDISHTELTSGEGRKKLVKAIFRDALQEDLADLFQVQERKKNGVSKLFNQFKIKAKRTTLSLREGKRLETTVNSSLPVAAAASSAAFFPFITGAYLLKGGVRGILNKRYSLNRSGDDEHIYKQISLYEQESIRNSDGYGQGFEAYNDIRQENFKVFERLLLKKTEARVSQQLEGKMRDLSRKIESGEDTRVLYNDIRREITRIVIEVMMEEYSTLLEHITLKRQELLGRQAVEWAASLGSFGALLLGVGNSIPLALTSSLVIGGLNIAKVRHDKMLEDNSKKPKLLP